MRILDERFTRLVDEGTEVEQLASGGYHPAEGPVWVADGEYLLFSDIFHSKRFRWDERAGVREVAAETGCGNGMTIDLEGRLVVCSGATGRILRMDVDGTGRGTEVIASHYDGKRLNSPNDIVVRSDGSVYFTDPWTAHLMGTDREQELDVQAVWRIAPDGALHPVVDDFGFPNGLCFSPDESILYVNDYHRYHVRAFEVAAAGSVGNGRVFAEDICDPTKPGMDTVDGMKCDEHGNLWCTGPGGIWVFSPDGERLGAVDVPERTQNFHWGGADWQTVFVTASTSVYRFRAKVAGRLEPFMTMA